MELRAAKLSPRARCTSFFDGRNAAIPDDKNFVAGLNDFKYPCTGVHTTSLVHDVAEQALRWRVVGEMQHRTTRLKRNGGL